MSLSMRYRPAREVSQNHLLCNWVATELILCEAAMPHVLAALARASLERYNPGSKANIRNAFSIHVLKRMARESGWALAGEKMVVPDEGLEDGKWEVGSVVHEGFLIEVFENVEDERVRILLESMREAVKAAVSNLGEDEKVRTMDVWTGVFQ